MEKKSKKITVRSKVFGSATKGKLGNLTFGDVNSLIRLLQKYKGELPDGYSRLQQIAACIVKRP